MRNNKGILSIGDILLFLMIFMLFIYDTASTGQFNTLTNIIVILFVLFVFFQSIKKKKLNFKWASFYLLFMVICLISCLYSPSQTESLSKIRSISIIIIIYLSIINYVDTEDQLNKILKYISICGFFASLSVIFSSNWYLGERVSGIIGDANQSGAYLSYASIVILYCIKRKIIKPIFGYFFFGCILFEIIISGSRSSLISIVIGILVFSFFSREKSVRWKDLIRSIVKVFIPIMFIVVLIYLIFNNELFYNIVGIRFESFYEIMNGRSSPYNESSTKIRMYLIKLAFSKWLETPFTMLFGHGISSFGYNLYLSGGHNTFSHNNYVELLYGVGFFGLISYYFSYFRIALTSIKMKINNKIEKSLIISIIFEISIMHFFVVFYYYKLEGVFLALLSSIIFLNINKSVEGKKK